MKKKEVSPCCKEEFAEADCELCNGMCLDPEDENEDCPECSGDGARYGVYVCLVCGDEFEEGDILEAEEELAHE